MFHIFERGTGNKGNDAAFGVQLADGEFADVQAWLKAGTGSDNGVHLRIRNDTNFEIMLRTLEFFGLTFHLAADATALGV